MGILRIFLAISVAYYHIDDWTKISGQGAVFCFYVISGYLIAKTYTENYKTGAAGLMRFYANRLIKLVPMFAAAVIFTVAISFFISSYSINHVGLQFIPYSSMVKAAVSYDAVTVLKETLLVHAKWESLALLFTPTPRIVPQGWSLTIELMFYAIAPFIVFVGAKFGRIPLVVAAFASLVFALWLVLVSDEFSLAYEHFPPSLYAFLLGYFSYSWGGGEKSLSVRNLYAVYVGLPLILLGVFAATTTKDPHFYYPVIVVCAIFVAVCVPLIVNSQNLLGKYVKIIDKNMAALSFGVYVFHNSAAIAMMALGAFLADFINVSEPFGSYRSPEFIFFVIALTIVLSVFFLLIIEHPLQSVRSSLRGHEKNLETRRHLVFVLKGSVLIFFVALLANVTLSPWSLEGALAKGDVAAARFYVERQETPLERSEAQSILCLSLGADEDLALQMRQQLPHEVQCGQQTALQKALSLNAVRYVSQWADDFEEELNQEKGCEIFGRGAAESADRLMSHYAGRLPGCSVGEFIEHAAAMGDPDMVEAALAIQGQRSDPEVLAAALCEAVIGGHSSVVERLLKHGAVVPGACSNGLSPLDIASRAGHDGMLGLLRSGLEGQSQTSLR